jgi:hypothetical protein
MASESKLRFLLELMDDESAEVRSEILRELNNYGLRLEEDLNNYPENMPPGKSEIISPIILENRRKWLTENWLSLSGIEDRHIKIETALDLISRFQYGKLSELLLGRMLDGLTEEFKNKIPYGDELDLSNFLFQEKGMRGANENYYNPFNSNAVYTINEKSGLPLTLSLIFILAGNRLGFDIRGCGLPGHFLSKIIIDEEIILIDPFEGGRIIFESDINEAFDYPVESVFSALQNEPTADQMISRLLKNLIKAYSFINDDINRELFTLLLHGQE